MNSKINTLLSVGERLGLTLATQTTFSTAVSEISRMVIEHTDDGILEIGLIASDANIIMF